MGMYDTVVGKCKSCGGRLEFQSKAGNCSLAEYDPPQSAPTEVLADVNGDVASCNECGELGSIHVQFIKVVTID